MLVAGCTAGADAGCLLVLGGLVTRDVGAVARCLHDWDAGLLLGTRDAGAALVARWSCRCTGCARMLGWYSVSCARMELVLHTAASDAGVARWLGCCWKENKFL